MRQRRRHLLDLFIAEILPRHETSKRNAWIERVWRDVAIFVARFHRPPIMKIQRTVTAAAWRGRRTAVLLCSVHPVRKPIVRSHMIELPGGLVVPGTPSFTAVARHDRVPRSEEHTSELQS